MPVTIRGQRIECTNMEVSPLNLGGGEAFYSLFSRCSFLVYIHPIGSIIPHHKK